MRRTRRRRYRREFNPYIRILKFTTIVVPIVVAQCPSSIIPVPVRSNTVSMSLILSSSHLNVDQKPEISRFAFLPRAQESPGVKEIDGRPEQLFQRLELLGRLLAAEGAGGG